MKYIFAVILVVLCQGALADPLVGVCEHDYTKHVFYTPEEMVTEANILVALERMKKFYTGSYEYRWDPVNAMNLAQDKRALEAYEYKLQIIDGVKRGHKLTPEIYQEYCKILNMQAKRNGS